MKRYLIFLTLLISCFLTNNIVSAGPIIDRGATSAEAIAQTRDDVRITPHVLPGFLLGLPDTTAVSADWFPFYDVTTGKWAKCDGDEVLGGGGGSGNNTIIIKEDNVTIDATVGTLDFLGDDFDVTEDPEDEANIALASGINATKIGDGSVDDTMYQRLADLEATDNVTFNKVTSTEGFEAGATTLPGFRALDSDAPGTDKDGGRVYWNYIDGDDGSENFDFIIDITQGGSEETTILEFDESDDRWEIPTGKHLAFGTTQWDDGSDKIDGEQIAADSIDDDSIDWSDCTFADFEYQTAWRVFYSDADGDVTELALGADGTYLKSNGAEVAPTFDTPGGSGSMAAVEEGDSQVGGSDIVTLDFLAADFIIGEDPNTEINISIDYANGQVATTDVHGFLSDTDWDTFNGKQAAISGTDTHVIFFDGANTPAGEAGMTYNKATDVLTLAGGLIIPDAGTIGSTSDTDALSIAADGDVDIVNDFTAGTIASDGLGTFVNLSINNADTSAGYIDIYEDTDNGGNYVRLLGPPSTDDITISIPATTGTLALISDATYTASVGYALGSGDYIGITGNEIITFNEAGTINFTGASVDIDGAFTASTVGSDGAVTAATNVVIGDAGNIGSASDTDAIAIAADGVVTLSQKLITSGGVASLTPVSGNTTAFSTNFTGANLYGGTYIVTADEGDLSLPEMAAGMNFTIIVSGAIECVAATNANDGYMLDGVDTAEDNSVVSPGASGDIAVFQYYTADDWLITTNGWTTE